MITAEQYFAGWINVIDKMELNKIMRWLLTIKDEDICPSKKKIFRSFFFCPYQELRVVCLGQDPYPQPGVATGIMFGNSSSTSEEQLSPSLKVIKECAINYEIPHGPIIFDNTLESWAKQGVLLLNSALTCKVNEPGSHLHIWVPFISKLVENISIKKDGLVFVLFGAHANYYKKYIKGNHKIIEIHHPAYYARMNKKMPYETFTEINKYLKAQYNEQINFYTDVCKQQMDQNLLREPF